MKINRRKFLSSSIASVAALSASHSTLARAWDLVPASALASDPRRPQFHLLPARNWMNDPNGPIFWNGNYHMFFQYNPHAAVWGDMHWNHAVSPDMVHWRHLPIALAPTPGGPDADGCFSGSAVVNNGVVTFIYTGIVTSPPEQATLRDGKNNFRESQLYATSRDPELITWTKQPAPVIATPPPGLHVTGFRDPAPWRMGDTWYMAVGSGLEHEGGVVLLYKSSDLRNWEYLHFLARGNGKPGSETNPVDSGDMWECPDFFALGDKHVLIYSTLGKVFWQVGDLDTKEMLFHPLKTGILDFGSFYAPKTQLDKSGNRILWGWVPETRPEAEFSASGWAGLFSLPRIITLGKDNTLRFTVAGEVDALREKEQRVALNPSQGVHLKDACGELLCTVKQGSEPFAFDLVDANAAPNAPSLLSISTANFQDLSVDQKSLTISRAQDEPLELHFYIDGSVIELFVNKQAMFTKRFYYPGPTAPEIGIKIAGNTAGIQRLSLWQLRPISKDRLTT